MQSVALEMNLSESAFVVGRGDGDFDLRWFTPAAEVDLCGHATLASAHVLLDPGAAGSAVRFHTRSGMLVVHRAGDGRLVMDFPAEPAEAAEPPAGLEEALGARIVAFGRNRMDVLAELEDEHAVRGLKPDLPAIARLDVRGVIVTAAGSGEFDFVSRFFGPAVGVPEDPVTGSAHCALAPWWGERTGKARMTGWQASARGGRVDVARRGDRVELTGSAVTVSEGRVLVPG